MSQGPGRKKGQLSRIHIELPPPTEVWKEAASIDWHSSQGTDQGPKRTREEAAVMALKLVGCVVDLEHLFGPGLIQRWLDSTKS